MKRVFFLALLGAFAIGYGLPLRAQESEPPATSLAADGDVTLDADKDVTAETGATAAPPPPSSPFTPEQEARIGKILDDKLVAVKKVQTEQGEALKRIEAALAKLAEKPADDQAPPKPSASPRPSGKDSTVPRVANNSAVTEWLANGCLVQNGQHYCGPYRSGAGSNVYYPATGNACMKNGSCGSSACASCNSGATGSGYGSGSYGACGQQQHGCGILQRIFGKHCN